MATEANASAASRTITRRHPGDVLFDDLGAEQQHGIVRGWQLDPTDVGDLAAAKRYFNQRSHEDRWRIITASELIDGSYQAEVARINANADPDTVKAQAQPRPRIYPSPNSGWHGDWLPHTATPSATRPARALARMGRAALGRGHHRGGDAQGQDRG